MRAHTAVRKLQVVEEEKNTGQTGHPLLLPTTQTLRSAAGRPANPAAREDPGRGSARSHDSSSPKPSAGLTWSGTAGVSCCGASGRPVPASPSHSSQSPPRSAAAAFNPPRGRLSPPAGGAGVPGALAAERGRRPGVGTELSGSARRSPCTAGCSALPAHGARGRAARCLRLASSSAATRSPAGKRRCV